MDSEVCNQADSRVSNDDGIRGDSVVGNWMGSGGGTNGEAARKPSRTVARAALWGATMALAGPIEGPAGWAMGQVARATGGGLVEG